MAGRQRGGKVGVKPTRQLSDEEESELSELEEEVAEATGRLRKRPRTSLGKAPTVTRSGRVSRTVQDLPSTILSTQPLTKTAKRLRTTSEETPSATCRGRSTRTSRRSGVLEDQWEPIPEEWLQPATADVAKLTNGKRRTKKVKRNTQNPLDSDSSELSDLSFSEDQEGPESGMDSDLTSISSSTLSELGDLPEEVAGDHQMGNAIPSALNVEKASAEVDSSTNAAETAHAEGISTAAVDISSSGNGVTHGRHGAMDVDTTSQQEISVQTSEQNDPKASALPGSDTDIAMMATSTAESDPRENSVIENHDAKLGSGHQEFTEVKVSTPHDQEPVESLVPPVDSNHSDAAPIDVTLTDTAPEIPSNIASQQSPAAEVSHDHDPAGGETANELKKMEESTQNPEEKAAEIDSKTVLAELSVEIQEALEEEEDNPRDEVRSFIKKSRNPGYLEWELVSYYLVFHTLCLTLLLLRSVRLDSTGKASLNSMKSRAMRTKRRSIGILSTISYPVF